MELIERQMSSMEDKSVRVQDLTSKEDTMNIHSSDNIQQQDTIIDSQYNSVHTSAMMRNQKNYFHENDPSMRITKVGKHIEDEKVKENKYSKRTYQQLLVDQKHQATFTI